MATRPKPTAKLATALNYINTLDLFRVTEHLIGDKAGDVSSPKTNYQALLNLCEEVRKKHGLRPADATVASMAVDLRSEKQLRFVDALSKMGMVTDPVDYRWAQVGSIGGRPDEQERPHSSMGAQVGYILGLVAGRSQALGVQAEVIVVTGVFDVYRSMLDLVQSRGGRAVLMFPRSMLDYRWSWVGLGTADCPVVFEDLEPHAEVVFGVTLDVLQAKLQLPRAGGLASI